MKKKFGITVVLTMILTLLLSNVSFAITPTNSNLSEKDKKKIVQLQKDKKDFYKNIKQLEKFVVRNADGTFAIKGNPNVDKNFVEQIQTNINETNKLVNEGYLTTDSNLRVYANSKYVLQGNTDKNKDQYIEYDTFFSDVNSNNVSISLGNKTLNVSMDNKAYAYNPPVGYYAYWWGWQLSMSEWTTQNIIYAMNAGGAITAIAAVLATAGIFSAPAAVPLGIISGCLWLGATEIGWVDYWGGNKGVYIQGYWVGNVWYIWHRY